MESPSATKAQAQEKHNESKVQKDIESTNPPQEDVKCEELKPHLTVETPAEDPAPAPSEVGAKIHVTLELSKLKHNVNNFRLVYNLFSNPIVYKFSCRSDPHLPRPVITINIITSHMPTNCAIPKQLTAMACRNRLSLQESPPPISTPAALTALHPYKKSAKVLFHTRIILPRLRKNIFIPKMF